jgi:hypothetical protein
MTDNSLEELLPVPVIVADPDTFNEPPVVLVVGNVALVPQLYVLPLSIKEVVELETAFEYQVVPFVER